MAKKKKDDAAAAPKPKSVGTSLKGLLAGVQSKLQDQKTEDAAAPRPPSIAKRKKESVSSPLGAGLPSDSLRGPDRTAFHDAMAEARPISGKPLAIPVKKPASSPSAIPAHAPSDAEARARLSALVGGGVRFDIERDGDEIRGSRAGAPPRALRQLLGRSAPAEATIDLHGMTGREAEAAVTRFVREQHRRGSRSLRIVHGKGLHSESGGVLRDHVVRALTETGAAASVLAFATAAHELGGSGAMIVALGD